MTLTLPLAPATGIALDFTAACRAILAGRPGALFYRGATPQFAAVEPWLVVTLYADHLTWRSFDSAHPAGQHHAARIDCAAGLALLQSLWEALDDEAGWDGTPARPQLPVWFAYELGEWLEPAVCRNTTTATAIAPRHRDAPLAGWLIPRAIIAADGGLDPASLPRGRRLLCRFEQTLENAPALPATAATAALTAPTLLPTETSLPDEAAEHCRYLAAVERVQQYIAAGDVYQVNVTRRERIDCAGAAGAWFAAALERHPAAQASYWSCVDSAPAGPGGQPARHRHFLSFTPERLLSIDCRANHAGASFELLSSPIKGTRPRPPQATAEALDTLATELMQDGKEQAELNMIIDMTRNDLGRVADLGSVRVLTGGRIDRLPFVLHRVADVAAQASRPLALTALLRALFPGASITGAPKIRAMQIIRELEPTPRGIYCGVLGWLSNRRRLDWALAIRTLDAATLADDPAGPWQGRFGVGAGIVADSVPDREWQESIAKSRGILR